jgi:hypothetical protein
MKTVCELRGECVEDVGRISGAGKENHRPAATTPVHDFERYPGPIDVIRLTGASESPGSRTTGPRAQPCRPRPTLIVESRASAASDQIEGPGATLRTPAP